jgi:acetyltransferase-like isoleucine patch superfamily enzyme
VTDGPDERCPGEVGELAADLAAQHRQAAQQQACGRAGVARADRLAADAGVAGRPALPPRPAPTRWGWRRALAFAVCRGMLTPGHVPVYARYLAHRLRHPWVDYRGLVFFGPRVELLCRRGHGRLELGPWVRLGADNRLRAHEGSLRVGPKVVLGRDNTLDAYLDIEIGQNALLSDWIYVADFDHRHEDPGVPIRKQGLVKTPVRIGADVWVGEKASVLRGADIGAGSVIGSQTVVTGAIPPFSVAVGRPARVIASRLPAGMTAEEALDRQRRGLAIPGDPVG